MTFKFTKYVSYICLPNVHSSAIANKAVALLHCGTGRQCSLCWVKKMNFYDYVFSIPSGFSMIFRNIDLTQTRIKLLVSVSAEGNFLNFDVFYSVHFIPC